MKVSVLVIALNEEKSLPGLLKEINAQTYLHSNMEIVLVDSGSTDNTKEIMNKFKENSDFSLVKVIDNPEKILAHGWNKAIKASEGDIIMRIDAHASIPSDFVEKNVELILSGEYVCGGKRPNILADYSEFGEILLLSEKSAFGSSIAKYRDSDKKQYVDSIFHGAYKREVFKRVGLLNVDLGRTEDNEMHYRIRKAGYKICMDPNIVSYQHVRSTLKKMLKQKYLNGYWVGLTTGVCHKCLKIYHFVPVLFVGAIIACTAIYKFIKWPLKLLIGTYMIANILMSILTLKNEKSKNKYKWALPFLFLGIHLSYGIGTLVGFIKLPKWLKRYKKTHKDEFLDK